MLKCGQRKYMNTPQEDSVKKLMEKSCDVLKNTSVVFKKGINVISDNVDTKILFAPASLGQLLMQNLFGLPDYVTRELRYEHQRRKFWATYVEGNESFWQEFVKPEFFNDYQVASGALREGEINSFDKSGSRFVVGGSFLRYLEFFNNERIKKIEDVFNTRFLSQHVGEYIRETKDIGMRGCINERDTNKICIGGFVPNKITEKIIFEKAPDITYRDARNPDESISADKLNHIREYLQFPDKRPKDWKSPDWCIAKLKNNGTCKEILIEPKRFPEPMTQYGETYDKIPFHVDGGLIVYTKYANKYHLVEGGIRASATAVLPDILNYPMKYFGDDSLEKIKEVEGDFVAAVKIRFKRCAESSKSYYVYEKPPRLEHIDGLVEIVDICSL